MEACYLSARRAQQGGLWSEELCGRDTLILDESRVRHHSYHRSEGISELNTSIVSKSVKSNYLSHEPWSN